MVCSLFNFLLAGLGQNWVYGAWCFLTEGPINGFWPVWQSRQHELKAYCPYIYCDPNQSSSTLIYPLHPQISLKPEFDTYILPKINLKNYSFSSLTILPLTLLKAPRPLQNPFINEKTFWKIPQWILLVGLWLSKSPFNAPIPTKTYEKLKNLKLNHKQISTLNLTLGCSVNDRRILKKSHKNA